MEKELVDYMRDLDGLLDVRGQWAMFRNSKTASTSMEMGPLNNLIITMGHGQKNYKTVWRELFESRMEKIFTFSFVRNPWDRVFSAFNYLQNYKFSRIQLRRRRHQLRKDVEFKDYIKTDFLEEGPSTNIHFAEQAPKILFNGNQFVSFIGRFENLEDDWRQVANKIGVSGKLQKRNVTSHLHYSNYYDDECIEIVRNTYKEEIDFLGYKYEKRTE
jgi:hypothetical protein